MKAMMLGKLKILGQTRARRNLSMPLAVSALEIMAAKHKARISYSFATTTLEPVVCEPRRARPRGWINHVFMWWSRQLKTIIMVSQPQLDIRITFWKSLSAMKYNLCRRKVCTSYILVSSYEFVILMPKPMKRKTLHLTSFATWGLGL